MCLDKSPNRASADAPTAATLALALFNALRAQENALVQGEPSKTNRTLIDGRFDLTSIAESLLNPGP